MSNPDEIPREHYLQKWQTAIQIWHGETSKFWMRSNVFLLINGGLVAIIAALLPRGNEGNVQAAVSCAGGLLSFIWVKVNNKGRKNIDDWGTVVKGLEEHTGIKVLQLLEEKTDEYKKQHTQGFRKKLTWSLIDCMNYAVYIFLAMYVFLFFYSVLQ